MTEGSWFDSQQELQIFVFSNSPDRVWGSTHPPVHGVPWGLLPEVKQLNTYLHLAPSSRNTWSATSTPPYAFIAQCSINLLEPEFYI